VISLDFGISEDDIVTLSEIEHYAYCPRQWALISIERLWADNRLTVRGTLNHERVDETSVRTEKGLRVLRGLTIWSNALRLYGRADVVEIRGDGTCLPVEHKSGRRMVVAATLQLAGQALCLEEMFGQPVRRGAIWLTARRRRIDVAIDDDLRSATLATVRAIRTARTTSSLPNAVFDQRCRDCSLINECLPQLTSDHRRAAVIHGMLFSSRGPRSERGSGDA